MLRALVSARKPRQALPRPLTHDCLLAQGSCTPLIQTADRRSNNRTCTYVHAQTDSPPPSLQWTLTVRCVWRDDDTDSVITTSCMQREHMHVNQAQIAITHFRRAATHACSEEDDWTYCRISGVFLITDLSFFLCSCLHRCGQSGWKAATELPPFSNKSPHAVCSLSDRI